MREYSLRPVLNTPPPLLSSPPPMLPPSELHLAWRSTTVLLTLTLAWGVLMGRIIQIQCLQRDKFASRAVRQQQHDEVIPARPGDLFDRKGRLLATTIAVQSLYVDPARVFDPLHTACAFAKATGIDPVELQQRLLDQREKRFLWVKRRLTEAEVAQVIASNLPAAEWGFRPEYLRVYPQGALAAHVLGWRDIDGIPHGGVEEFLNHRLRGEPGRRTVVRDARGVVIDLIDHKTLPAQAGENIQLTLEILSQLHVERRLDELMAKHHPLGACATVLDPATGEVLAMVSRPAFDPTHPQDAPPNSWRNLAIQAAYEPGSTIKPVIVAWGLDKQLLKKTDSFNCERGVYRMGPRVLHDHHRYGVLSLKDVLVKSSNIGMAKVGETLTNARLHQLMTEFNFGHQTGIELPGELTGTLHPLDQWTIYSTGSIPMGQEMVATPLQILAAHAALANGGRWVTPHLYLGSVGRHTIAPQVVTTDILKPESTRWVVEEAMVDVIQRGTGTKAKLDDYSLFGKTGTSQKMDPNGQYSHTRHISSFVCGAPVHNPRLVVIVTVDEPTQGGSDYGGMVAAPAAAEIVSDLLQYMQVPSDRPVQTATAAGRE